jgi:hypothetical protein
LIAALLSQIFYTALRDVMNIADFDILDIHTSLGKQMFAFVWLSWVASFFATLLFIIVGCRGFRRRK